MVCVCVCVCAVVSVPSLVSLCDSYFYFFSVCGNSLSSTCVCVFLAVCACGFSFLANDWLTPHPLQCAPQHTTIRDAQQGTIPPI